ncbi:MAG: metallophosphoesterase [Sphingobacteriaceae bacterium]|nr:metallophosphoesterase [Sphingobacteriaceae bacterium]
MKRRNFLKSGAALATLAALPTALQASKNNDSKQSLSFAMLTDVHIFPGEVPEKGFAAALQSIAQHPAKPSFIVNGGDAILDSLDNTEEAIAAQWQKWHQIVAQNTNLPFLHCLGNHDVYGWTNKNEAVKNRADYGKKRFLNELKLQQTYAHTQKGNWHFIVLDSIHPHPKGFEARLDENQFQWLSETLAKIPQNEYVILVSHVPLLSAVYRNVFEGKESELFTDLTDRILAHRDVWRIKELISKHKNIKICLSGHLHLQEEIKYLHTSYINCGAVSGNWWKGALQEFAPAYFVFNLADDGTFNYEVVNY